MGSFSPLPAITLIIDQTNTFRMTDQSQVLLNAFAPSCADIAQGFNSSNEMSEISSLPAFLSTERMKNNAIMY